MAPPIPLPHVASTLALSFTAGRAEPAPEPGVTEPPTVQRAEGSPRPPTLPDVPGATAEPEPSAEPESTTPSEDGEAVPPDPSSESLGATPPPVEEPSPVLSTPFEPSAPTVAPFDDERPLSSSPTGPTKPTLFRETDKKYFFNLFVGGSRNFRGYYNYTGGMDFKSEVAIGGGTPGMRIGGAAVIQVSSGFPLNTFTIAPRLQLNRQIVPDYAFYFTTTLSLGYRASMYSSYGIFQGLGNVYQHSGVGAVGWGVSAIVADRLLLSFRPLNLEVAVPAPNLVDFNWDVFGGLGVIW